MSIRFLLVSIDLCLTLYYIFYFSDQSEFVLQQIPLSHISDAVYKTSADWISQRSLEALGFFVLWSLDIILEDLAAQQASAKGSKKGAQQTSLKSKVNLLCNLVILFGFSSILLVSDAFEVSDGV